eukprot:gene25342-28360_t
MRGAAALLLAAAASANKKNVMTLDTFSFEKVVGGPLPVLLKFDKEF